MGFDSRHLVFEFLAENRSLNITQLTLVFLGKNTDPFLHKAFNNTFDKVFVYHSKGTRLFWKEYNYDMLNGTIIELLLESRSSINLSKKDLTFNLTEPYYFLDLRKFDFEYLSAIPLIENDLLIGYSLLYTSTILDEANYPIISIKRLFRNIIKNENYAKYQELDSLLNNNFGYIEFEQVLYLSKELANSLSIEQKVYDNKLNVIREIYKNNFIDKNIIYENYHIHILEKDVPVLQALEELDKPKEYHNYTLFYVYDETLSLTQLFNIIKNKVREYFPNIKVCYYRISNHALGVLINKKTLKKELDGFIKELSQFIVIGLREKKDILSKTSLMNVLIYLDQEKKREFNIKDYHAFRQQESINKYIDTKEERQ